MRRLLLSLALLASVSHSQAESEVIDRSGSWDVNAPLGPSRQLEFTTDEGTWMNLDVHPDGSHLVFDLLGDLYLLPIAGGAATRLTQGQAYDFQARFSPDGTRIVFTSDRGGVNNLWLADFDGQVLAEPKPLVDQPTSRYGGADWTADGRWILARKRVTDISSIGISELWMFSADGGAGIQLVADKGEVDSFSVSPDGRYVYYGNAGPFSYGANPHGSLWHVNRLDRETGEKKTLFGGNGSAAAPALSPDGETVAFVRRVGVRSTLWLHDLNTGAERQLWDGLDRDQIEGFGTNFIYPGYDWMPDGNSLVVWAGGKINRVAVASGAVTEIPFSADVSVRFREPLRSERDPAPETLRAQLIRWPVISPNGESLVFNALGHVYWMSLPDGTPERVTDDERLEFAPVFAPNGGRLLFTTWSDTDGATVQSVSMRRGRPGGSTTLYESPAQLVNPTLSPDGERLLVVAGSGASLRGEDLGRERSHRILLLDADGGAAEQVTTVNNRGSNRRITRPTFSADGTRVWYFEDEPSTNVERGSRTPPMTVLRSVRLDGSDKKTHMRFRYAQEVIVSPDETMVAFTEQHNAHVTALPRTGSPVDFDPAKASVAFEQLSRDGGEWVRWSADGEYLSWGFGTAVHRLPVNEISLVPKAEPRDAGDSGVAVFAVDVRADGRYGLEGRDYELEALQPVLEAAWQEAAVARVDVSVAEAAPWSAWTALNTWLGEAKVAVKQVEPEAAAEEAPEDAGGVETESARAEYAIELEVPRARPEGRVALTGARIITMRGDEIIDNGTVLIEGNRIAAVGANVMVPADAETIDVSGRTIIPGLVDVHAHMGYGVLDINPQQEWRYYANLAYGVTTTHDPSASTHTVFSQSEMVEAGIMVGPRIYSTGFILYGALIPDMAVINSYADALSHVRRLKTLGAFSVKSYEQPRRDQRQWVILAASEEEMLVMPEGGGNLPANVGMILDGHSGIEHSLSIAQIYRDLITLFAESRSAYTGTLLVSYGGQQGENWFYQHYNAWENEKLQSFHPPRVIDARSRRRPMSAEDDFNHKLVAEHQRQIDDAGGLITLGAHGQLQGLGAHWELWALSHGGMSPHRALRAATINGAEYLGLDKHLGSIEVGKLADLAVLDRDPLERIENSDSVSLTVINGVVYDANSMNQVWPERVERRPFHFERAGP